MHSIFALLLTLGVALAHPLDNTLEQGTVDNRDMLLFPESYTNIPIALHGENNEKDVVDLTPEKYFTDSSPRIPLFTVYRQQSRERRSVQPGNTPYPGQPQPGQGQPSNTGVDVDVQRSRAGTHLSVDAQRNVYRSPDGRTSVDAHGRYDRVYNGPGATRPNYNAGVRFSHKW